MKDTLGKQLVIEITKNNSSIREPITSNTNLNASIDTWNLNAIDSIQVIDSIRDDHARKEVAFHRRRQNNIVTWAVMGGVIDGVSGDDTVLDGVVLGGLFGMATSGSAEKPIARILLTFTNGDKLGLTVDQDELLKIMEVKQVDDLVAGKKNKSLTLEQRDLILNLRRSRVNTTHISMAVLSFVVACFVFMTTDISDDLIYWKILLYICFFGLILCSLTFVLLGLELIKQRPKESFIRANEKEV
ncbi:hypothetical protein GHT89_16625 [Acinetobacter baumannii]|uniref:hypothetical protein n=1 Tax=Acinetobacter baumannii TaxID=470 RepID=UPI00387DCFB4